MHYTLTSLLTSSLAQMKMRAYKRGLAHGRCLQARILQFNVYKRTLRKYFSNWSCDRVRRSALVLRAGAVQRASQMIKLRGAVSWMFDRAREGRDRVWKRHLAEVIPLLLCMCLSV